MKKNSKRIFDFCISLVLLLMLMPLFLIVSLLIKINSKGPVFFKQERVGLKGKIFQLYKFRSMLTGMKGHFSTSFNDPRITPLGKLIRKSSIDELPQLINVLKGEMSLVGPRPNVSEQEIEYSKEHWNLRNSVLPGITGLAQVTRRSLATPEERLNLDLEYVKKRSFLLDISIILKTFLTLISKKGN